MRLASILTALLGAAVAAAIAVLPQRLCFSGGQNYTFYCGESSADCREVRAKANAELERLTLSDVCGESAEYDDFDLQAFLKKVNGKVVFTEKLSDSVNYYCTADLPYSVNLYNHTINLHVCVREDTTKVASPIIFGGY